MPNIEELLKPIDGELPSGKNIEDGDLYDKIRVARESDDAFLNQGEWDKSLKEADWSEVIDLCKAGLISESKDLMLASWLIEAWVWKFGFDGVQPGFDLLKGLVEQYWEGLHPLVDEDGLEYRAARITWLNKTLPEALQNIPLVDKDNGDYSLWRWFEVLQVENLERKDAELAMHAQQNEGKINKKVFEDAILATSYEFYQGMLETLDACLVSYDEMEAYVDALFEESEPPCLTAVKHTLKELRRLVVKIYEMKGLNASGVVDVEEVSIDLDVDSSGVIQDGGSEVSMSNNVMSRNQALSQLRKIATFFRQTEPHTPVAPLIDKAVKWADMPFSDWLTEVIKDDGSRSHVSELLGLKLSAADSSSDDD